jgi:hypothetical protein
MINETKFRMRALSQLQQDRQETLATIKSDLTRIVKPLRRMFANLALMVQGRMNYQRKHSSID